MLSLFVRLSLSIYIKYVIQGDEKSWFYFLRQFYEIKSKIQKFNAWP